MKVPAIILAMFLACCCAPWNASPQDNSCSKFLIPLTVRDARGEVIHGFSANDLEVTVDGGVRPADRLRREDRPRRIVILLDASGSMKGTAEEIPWRQAVGSAQTITMLSEGRARLALVVFNSNIVEEIPFSADNAAITKRLIDLGRDREFFAHSVTGAAHLNDALARALQLLGQATSADVLYIASHAQEHGSHQNLPALKQELLESGVRVFLTRVEMESQNPWNKPNEQSGGQWSFESLVEQTGGQSMSLTNRTIALGFQTRRVEGLMEAVRMYYEGLFDNEVLEIIAPQPAPKKQDLKVALSASGREHLAGAQLFFPRQPYACPPPSSATAAP